MNSNVLWKTFGKTQMYPALEKIILEQKKVYYWTLYLHKFLKIKNTKTYFFNMRSKGVPPFQLTLYLLPGTWRWRLRPQSIIRMQDEPKGQWKRELKKARSSDTCWTSYLQPFLFVCLFEPLLFYISLLHATKPEAGF